MPFDVVGDMVSSMRNIEAMKTAMNNASRRHQEHSGFAAAALASIIAGIVTSIADRHSTASEVVVLAGEPPLTETVLQRFVAVMTIVSGAPLTLNEDETLREIVKSFWMRNRADEMVAVSSVAQHSAKLTNPPTAAWLGDAGRMVGALSKLPEGEVLEQWSAGFLVRALYLPAAVNALDARKAIQDAADLSLELTRAKGQVAELQAEKKRLSDELVAAKRLAGEKERMANALQSSLDQILAGDTPAVPENLERQLRIVLVKHKLSSSFYIDPQIPPTKLFNAKQTCKVPVDEKPLALLDMTMFGSAKDAIVFGVRGLYYSRKGKTMQSLYTGLSKLEAEAVMGDIHFFPRGERRPEARTVMTVGTLPSETTKLVALFEGLGELGSGLTGTAV